MPGFLDRVRMVPDVTRLAAQAPRDPTMAWEGFWSRISATGHQGDVLWDAGTGREAEQYEAPIRTFMDATLPVVDIGCGNGRWTRWLAERFPQAMGVDVSASAVHLAEEESGQRLGLSFRVLDLTEHGAGRKLHSELGDTNVFVRGLFHTLPRRARVNLTSNLRDMVGDHGRVLLTETNFRGGALSYLQSLGAAPGAIPVPLRHAISGIPRPHAFGAPERRRAFPEAGWTVLDDGPVTIEAVPTGDGEPTGVPAYFAMLSAR